MPTQPIHWPDAPTWAVDASYFGKFLIILALVGFVSSIIFWWIQPKKPQFAWIGKAGFIVGTVSLFATIILLGTLFVTNQFEFAYIFDHGDVGTEIRYRIAGIWSGQEGSFLLWGCTTSLFCTLAAFGAGIFRRWFTIAAATFLTAICAILLFETPFTLTMVHGHIINPGFGAGLQPSLENRWVVIHPPTIFSGFGSLAVAAAFGFSAMMTRNVVDYVKLLRPWVILSTSILGLGLCLGGFWAYETLGWGGFWMWDPVENVSFVPWICSIVLLHGLIVQTAKKQWIGPNLVFAGIPFFAFCYGTFLTRSGFLGQASVHSFVNMNHIALWILVGTSLALVITYYTLYFRRGKSLAREAETSSPEEFAISRQKMYSSGMILLGAIAISAAIGMSVPFMMDIAHRNPKAVEEGLYHQILTWFYVPMMIAMGIAPFVSWRKMPIKEFFIRITNVLALSIGGLAVVLFAMRFIAWHNVIDGKMTFPFHVQVSGNAYTAWVLFLLGLSEFVIIANGWRIFEVFRRSKLSIGGFIAHIGIAVLMAGMLISEAFQQKASTALFLSQGSTQALGYDIKFLGMTEPNEMGIFKHDNKMLFDLTAGNDHFVAKPGLYYTRKPDTGQLTPEVWPYQEHRLLYDIYFTLGFPQFDAWKNPVKFKAGQTLTPEDDGIQVTYKGLKILGGAGKTGTKFVADTTVSLQSPETGQWVTYKAEPALEITSKGLNKIAAPVGKDFTISMNSLDAATKSADLQVHFSQPAFPIDLFYKPMVILVWAGAVITFLGGCLAAFYRRPPRPPKSKKPKSKKTLPPLDENLDPGVTELAKEENVEEALIR